MERQREKPSEIPKEVKEKAEKDLEELRKELARLRSIKKEKDSLTEVIKKAEEIMYKHKKLQKKDDPTLSC